MLVASDFEIMTTLVELSMEGKSNLLRINIEEPKDNTRIIGTQTRKSETRKNEERQFKPKHNIMNLFTRN